ncbi:serine hydrolase domain-containing protein [Aequorivita marina]|uniref:serine hydrolase domain-containing protein n=1 Tax=Aequorivita marina TaxID=3073654 RepID=UPI0028756B39|nr:serine hydrolase domain-containing protein [Aequorivita sp. S2608]MDS1299162.1 serine hydrolase domain-containing protein [Aequorivita sp. S2608]
MKIKTALLVFVLGCSIAFISCNKNDNGDNSSDVQASMQRVADSIYNNIYDRWGIEQGGIHLYIAGPSGEYMASSNITPTPRPQTHFRIASISKTFTAASIMLLHQEGALNIDDLISEYLPNTPAYDIPYKNQITVKQLLQHRAGVFDVTNNDLPETINAPYAGMKYENYIRDQDDTHTFTFDEIASINAEHQLSAASPDVGFFYSNTGYALLGKIIEEVSGMRYGAFIDQKFAVPLGLTETYSPWNGTNTEMRTPYINSYLHLVGNGVLETPEDNVSMHVSSGNIVSTPKNVTTWMRLLLTGNAGINAENVALMQQMMPANDGQELYGLGLIYEEGTGYGHNGIHKSHVSALRYNPDTEISVLVSANFLRFDPSDAESVKDLGYLVRDALLPVVVEYQK